VTAVSVHRLVAGYGPVRVLDGIDLEIASGTVAAVLGASGSGKTTLLRILAGFIRPDAGVVRFGERTVAGTESGGADVFVPPEKRRVGIVPQEGALFPHLSVRDNIAFGLPRSSLDRVTRVDEVLELVDMRGYGDAHPQDLSGGQQQRIALARALAPRPDVLLLDEPFGSLDAALRVHLRAEVRDLLRSLGTTAVLVTHDQEEALSSADLLAVLRDGRIVQCGPPSQIYDEPADLGVARFVGEVVELPATRAGDRANCALGSVAVRPGGPDGGGLVAVLRPEQLLLAEEGGAPGTVVGASYFGHDSLLSVDLGDDTRIPVRVPAGVRPGIGARVAIRVTGEARLYRP